MKKEYLKPSICIITFELKDAILTYYTVPTEPPTEKWELEILGDDL